MERASVRLPLRVLADAGGWILSHWLVKPGSPVYRNQRVAALQSPATGAVDHALAPRGGTLARTLVEAGSRVRAISKADDGTVPSSPADFSVVIAEIEFCPHSVVFSGLCAVCGEEAAAGHFADVPADGPAARLPVAYNARTLSVTRAEAESIAFTHARELLEKRRLSLVLDLDHTLVHATDDPRAAAVIHHSPPGADVASIASFALGPPEPATGVVDSRMHVKLRPHLKEFLARCAELFELHIYTMGSRPYADRVAELIDPDKRLFSGRITSREDFEEGRSNQKNISRLFPCDDSMVLIIDDREDVWVSGTGMSFMPNLIRAKPYTFWSGLHEAYDRALAAGSATPVDVNAALKSAQNTNGPPNGSPSSDPSVSQTRDPAESNVDHGDSSCRPGGDPVPANTLSSTGVDVSSSLSDDQARSNEGIAKREGPLNAAPVLRLTKPEQSSTTPDGEKDASSGVSQDPMPELSNELRKLINQWWEVDSSEQGWNDHLTRLADVLELCHSRFFGSVSKTSVAGRASPESRKKCAEKRISNGRAETRTKIPADVKKVVADIRSKVLSGCVLAFTGVIPLNIAAEQSHVWELAERHGAVCSKDFVHGETTHIVASVERGASTEKARLALESGSAFVVDLAWLEDSALQFERRSEEQYSLHDLGVDESWSIYKQSVSASYAKAKEERHVTSMKSGGDPSSNSGGVLAEQRSNSAQPVADTIGEGESPPRKSRKRDHMSTPHGFALPANAEDGARTVAEDEVDDILEEAIF